MTRPGGRRGLAPMLALLAGALLGHLNGGCMEKGELQCEEAVGRILDCCALADLPSVECSHYESGCGEVFPEIDLAESRCIRGASCDELKARGVCAWARASASAPTTSAPPPSVCQ